MIRIEGNLGKEPHGIYDMMNGIGAHEVIIETPEHIDHMGDLAPEQIEKVLKAYKERIADLEGDAMSQVQLPAVEQDYLMDGPVMRGGIAEPGFAEPMDDVTWSVPDTTDAAPPEMEGLCGNGVVEAAEECDGADLGGESCESLNLGTGQLVCNSSCFYDVSGCSG